MSWHGSIPTRWVLLDKGEWLSGDKCNLRKWWAENHYTCLHIICFCSFWISNVAKHYWWAFWIISPLKATYKAPLTDFGTQFFFYIFVHFFDRMYLSALLNEHSFPPGYFPSVLISQVQVFFLVFISSGVFHSRVRVGASRKGDVHPPWGGRGRKCDCQWGQLYTERNWAMMYVFSRLSHA